MGRGWGEEWSAGLAELTLKGAIKGRGSVNATTEIIFQLITISRGGKKEQEAFCDIVKHEVNL